MQVQRIVPDLQSHDFAASRDFYENVLGIEVVMDQGWVRIYAAPDNPMAQITVMQRDATAPVNPDVSIELDDVDQAYAAAK